MERMTATVSYPLLAVDPVTGAMIAAGFSPIFAVPAVRCVWCNGRGHALSIDDLGDHPCRLCDATGYTQPPTADGPQNVIIATIGMNPADLRYGNIVHGDWIVGPHRSWQEWRIGHPDGRSYPIQPATLLGSANIETTAVTDPSHPAGSFGTWEQYGTAVLVSEFEPIIADPGDLTGFQRFCADNDLDPMGQTAMHMWALRFTGPRPWDNPATTPGFGTLNREELTS